MNFPIDIQLGSITIPSHALFEFLAFFIGFRYYLYCKSKRPATPISPRSESWIVFGAALGAFIGARLIAALEHPQLFMDPPSWIFYIGGQTVAGGLLGGILGVEISKKIQGIKRKTGDLFVFPLILGMIIGRIGCFLKGVSDGTVGLASNLPWALDQGDGILRHPTSLYEIIFLIASWIILRRIDKTGKMREGDLFSLFACAYFVFRFFVEYIKPRNPLLLDLSSIQIVSLAAVVYYSMYLIKKYLIKKAW